jgi:hypothetical protein
MRRALRLTEDSEIEQLDLDAGGGSLTILQRAVLGRVEVVGINHEFDMWVNEEGKFTSGLERNPIATVLLHWAGGHPADFVMGPVVFTGTPDDEGNTRGLAWGQLAILFQLFQTALDSIGPTEES